MKFITAVHFKHDGSEKVIFSSNTGENCIDAVKYGNSLPEYLTQIPTNAKDIYVRTYELGAINHLLN